MCFLKMGGRDSSVDIATRYGLDGPGIESRWGARFSAPVQTGPGAHPASCTMGTGSFPVVKRPGCDADHPTYLEPSLKKESSYTSTHPLGLRGLLWEHHHCKEWPLSLYILFVCPTYT